MTNLTNYPLEDGFETTLAQSWDGQLGDINVNASPSFTFPAGVTTYLVVDPGKTTMQIAEINTYDAGAKTITVSNITGLEKGAGIASTATNHTVGAKVIISDNYQFWKDIQTAINTKMNLDIDNVVTAGKTTFTSTAEAQFNLQNVTTTQRDALTGVANGDICYNTTTGVLNQYISGAWTTFASGTTANASTTVAGKVEIATTAEYAAGTDAGSTGAVLVPKPSDIQNSLPVSASETVEGLVEIATDAEVVTGTDTTRSITPKTLSDNYSNQDTVAIDWLLTAADTERSSSSLTFVKVKEFTILKNGTYNISFNLKRATGDNLAHGRIYKDGVAFGTDYTSASTSYAAFSDNLAFVAGDLCQLYIKVIDAANTSLVNNFRANGYVSSAYFSPSVVID